LPEPAPRQPVGERHSARGDAFERVLRQKSAARDDDPRTAADDPGSDDEPVAAALIGPPLPSSLSALSTLSALSPRRGESTAPSPAGALPAPSETMARLGHAAGADAPAGSALGVLRQDAALSFEVTLNDPRGIGLELRAQRTGGSQVGAAPAPWSLTVGSGLVDASVLARHAPRLNDRLLARVVTHGHVRIEGHAGANERDGDRGREGSA
jgi:hypothetical protein